MSIYHKLIEDIFLAKYEQGINEIEWNREDLISSANKLNIQLPKNLGDVIYSFRFRSELPKSFQERTPEGLEWLILLSGRGKYKFKLMPLNRIEPRQDLIPIDIPDATPDIIKMYSKTDEQALLTILRYNRIIDLFCQVTAYSLQNHLRTTVPGMGQIEIDEIYLGVDKFGNRFIITVQAKGGTDKLGVTQTIQDVEYCKYIYPELQYKALSIQFMDEDVIAVFLLDVINDNQVSIVEEKHYRLVLYNE